MPRLKKKSGGSESARLQGRPPQEERSGRDRALATLLGMTGAGTLAFWALFFAGKLKATETPQDQAFEKAFPLADTWMSACCLLAARSLWKGEPQGLFHSTAAGSSLVFLSLMDILYSLENGKYWPLDRDRAIMLMVHLWTLGVGTFALRRSFRRFSGSARPAP